MKYLRKYRHKAFDVYHSFTTGIQNLWYWFPVIWKDRDWDHAYMEYIMLHKLKQLYSRFSDPEKTCVNWTEESAAKQLQALKICIIILERMRTSFHWKVSSHHLQCDNIEQRDYRILYKLMGEYSQGWWD